MGSKGAGDRKSSVAKSGKRSGGYHEPPAPKPDNKLRRENGEQQFLAKEQLTVKKEIDVLMWDKSLKEPVFRTKVVTISADHIYDPNRGQLVVSPVCKEKKTK